jgi:hypothetical protein
MRALRSAFVDLPWTLARRGLYKGRSRGVNWHIARSHPTLWREMQTAEWPRQWFYLRLLALLASQPAKPNANHRQLAYSGVLLVIDVLGRIRSGELKRLRTWAILQQSLPLSVAVGALLSCVHGIR